MNKKLPVVTVKDQNGTRMIINKSDFLKEENKGKYTLFKQEVKSDLKKK